MPIITNKYGAPQILVDYANSKLYSRGASEISATQIIDSPRVVALKNKFGHLIEEDVSDMMWALMGTAMHHQLSTLGSDWVAEERLFTKVDGWTISGAIDAYKVLPDGTAEIGDYKLTTSWAVMNTKSSWEEQLNVYAWLVRTVKGLNVSKLSIWTVIRNWERHKTIQEGYPRYPIATVNVPVWSNEKQDEYIKARVAIHRNAYAQSEMDMALVQCNNDDMWRRKDVWAIMTASGKRAKKLLYSQEEADNYISIDPKLSIEFRAGEAVRCTNNYCKVNQWCDQWRDNETANTSTQQSGEVGGLRSEEGA